MDCIIDMSNVFLCIYFLYKNWWREYIVKCNLVFLVFWNDKLILWNCKFYLIILKKNKLKIK